MRAEGSLGSPQKEASEAGFLFFPIVTLDQHRVMSQCLQLGSVTGKSTAV